MFITTVCLVVYHVVAWLRALVDLQVLKNVFAEVLTIEASPMLLLLDMAPESEPAPVPASYSAFAIIAGLLFYFFAPWAGDSEGGGPLYQLSCEDRVLPSMAISICLLVYVHASPLI